MKTRYNWRNLELDDDDLEIVMMMLSAKFDEKLLFRLMNGAHKAGMNKAHRLIVERLENCRPNKN